MKERGREINLVISTSVVYNKKRKRVHVQNQAEPEQDEETH